MWGWASCHNVSWSRVWYKLYLPWLCLKARHQRDPLDMLPQGCQHRICAEEICQVRVWSSLQGGWDSSCERPGSQEHYNVAGWTWPRPHWLSLLVGIPEEVLDRPGGSVDILHGLGSSSLHGRTRQEWGNLRLLESKFVCGWVLRGSHEALQFPDISLKPTLSTKAHALERAVKTPPDCFSVFHMLTSLTLDCNFSELNELGKTPSPVCMMCWAVLTARSGEGGFPLQTKR